MDQQDQKKMDNYLQFVESLDLDQLKFDISQELGALSEMAGELLEAAEKNREIIPPRIKVRLSQDKLEAYLTVVTPGRPVAITEEDLIKALKDNGVVKGIIEKSIEEILVVKMIGQEVLVARGVTPKDGKDASIRPLQDIKKTNPEECVDATGRVDFKRMKMGNIVEKGELIAEKVPAVPGEKGYDVTGKILLPKSGKDIDFGLTPDVGISPANELELIALKNGVLKKDFTIEEINFIKGNVDYTTGNIKYSKSLVIAGDVKTGFSVHCGENVEIRGCVEDAEVVVDGDIVVKQGFLGDNKGLIKGRNVTVGHIKQQTVIASEDIVVGGEAIHASLQAGGFIKMLGIRGIAIGGTLIAGKGIEMMNAGNTRNVKTTLHVGYNQEIMELEKAIGQLKKNSFKAEVALRIFKAAGTVKELSREKKQLMKQVQETVDHLSEEINKLETQRLVTIESFLRREQPYIKVVHGIFPNTTVHIGHLKKLITAEMRNKRFCYHKNSIFTGL